MNLETYETKSGKFKLAKVVTTAEWDSSPELVLVNLAAVKAIKEQAAALFKHPELDVSDLTSVNFNIDPSVLFLTPVSEESESCVLIDGVLYKSSEDPSDFSDNGWEFTWTNVSARGALTVVNSSRHTSEELFYQLD